MKIIKKRISKELGFVSLIPQDDEDLWHLYNLIIVGDFIKASTSRKILRESQTEQKQAKKLKITLKLMIVQINYYAQGDMLALELKGKNMQQNEYLSMGQFHTFQIELGKPLTIYKDYWDSFHYRYLKQLEDPVNDSEVVALVMEEGIAHICFVKSSITLLKQKIEKNISKKKSGNEIYDKQMKEFLMQCFLGLMTINFTNIKCCIIASPGFVKDDFMLLIKEQAQSQEYFAKFKSESLIEKFLLVKSSSGYLNSLAEVLAEPQVMTRLSDTKAIKDIKVLEEFYSTMQKDADKITYGLKFVIEANNKDAIKTLLISDMLFRTKDLKLRRSYNQLVDQVKKKGGEVSIFSSCHKSGEKLNNLTGIAAILRFPYNLDYLDEDDEQEQQEVQQEEEKQVVDNDKKFEQLFGMDEDNGDEQEENEKNEEHQQQQKAVKEVKQEQNEHNNTEQQNQQGNQEKKKNKGGNKEKN